jgi:FAD/FMN-containing dehydrogenase
MENWAGNVKWTPQEVLLPKTEDEIAAIIKKATSSGKSIRTVGSHHSFTPLLATDSVSLSLDDMQGLISKEPNNRVIAWAGTKLKRLSELLAEAQTIFPNSSLSEEGITYPIPTSHD